MGFLKNLIAISVAAILFTACTDNVAQNKNTEAQPEAATPVVETSTPMATNSLPDATLQDVAGNKLNLQSLKGKKVFVNLWATWCPPCRAEMPSIQKLYEAAHKENTQFVMLSLDNDFESDKKYVQANNLNLPIYYPAGNLPDLFAVNGIPTTFIFDETGKLIEQREGSDDYNTAAYRKLFGAAK